MTLLKQALRMTLGRRLPLYEGRLSVHGVADEVLVRWDAYGIPYIKASRDDDAWFGLGFSQAQDRAFQLELRLRTLRGTLSAAIGEETLAIDRLARRIGFVDAARRQFAVLDEDVRRQVEAYTRGVNAGLRAGGRALAHEFVLLRMKPSEWRAEDVVGMGKLLSFLLIGNWDVELTRLKVLMTGGEQALRDLDPAPYPPEHVVVSPPLAKAGAVVDALGKDLEAFRAFAGGGGGSNAWVVGGAKTASGMPLVANDPHLEGVLPPHWYLASLETPEWRVAGASMVGMPGFGVGHNGYAAWGVTAGFADTSDLFIEDVGPDGRSVRHGDAYEACRVRREVIEVKGKSPVVEDVLETPRGPLIGPVLAGGMPTLSLRAVWLDARPARGFTQVHKVRSFADMQREFAAWPLLSQNVVYADVSGDIGWRLVGQVPRRSAGYGMVPGNGADPEAGWQEEYVAAGEMSSGLNPEAGFFATANNRPVQEDAGVYLGSDWLDGYRAGRISEALAERDGWDVASTQALQMDLVSLPWRDLKPVIEVLDALDEDSDLSLKLLLDWNGEVSAGSAAATVYQRFLREMSRRVARARAPHSGEWALGRGFTALMPTTTFSAGRTSRILRRLIEKPEGWFEHGWEAEMVEALGATVRGLRELEGTDPSGWAWGQVRPLTLEHPLGRVKALAPVFNRGPFAWGGDGNTVSQASGSLPMVIASMRAAIPVGDWDAARFVLPGGQSGNPFSPHYDDMLPLWRAGEGVAIAWSDAARDAAMVSELRLSPLVAPKS